MHNEGWLSRTTLPRYALALLFIRTAILAMSKLCVEVSVIYMLHALRRVFGQPFFHLLNIVAMCPPVSKVDNSYIQSYIQPWYRIFIIYVLK